MTATYTDNPLLNLKLPAAAGKNAQSKPKPSSTLDFLEDFDQPIVDRHKLKLPSTNGEVLDSPDEIATKAAAKDFLNNLPSQRSATKMPNLPVQYGDPVANQLFQLYFQGLIDSDKKQGIKSQLYQAPSNGKVIFCRDTCGYDKNQPIDPCYAYARYGIGLYISQRIIYNTYGVEDTDFIAEKARNFYTQFIADMEDYQAALSNSFSREEKAEKVNRYAREYLSDIVDNIALELTEQLGSQHKEFTTVEASVASLDSVIISASMACEPIPYVTREKFSYNAVNKEYVSIVHPKPGKKSEEIAELYENFSLKKNTVEEKKPFPLSNTEENTEKMPMSDGKGAHNFYDNLKACKKRVLHYFKKAILAGKVSLCSQDRSNFAGVKNVRVITTEEVIRDKQEQVQELKEIGAIAGNSTALAAFKNVSESVLVDYARRTLLQLHHTMTPHVSDENSTIKKRGLRLCVISLCGIDIKTTFDNRFNEENAQMDLLDAKIARLTDMAASETGGKVFSNNFAINFERLFTFIKGDDVASRLAQNAIEALTGYKNLTEQKCCLISIM
ncbi:MAG: hypothetical protein K0R24_4 [Gammaproteobacteria bacterium]|jgi:hypothetical protein|nr:hypothetical protein [Gammaproteobacteria bacterium]